MMTMNAQTRYLVNTFEPVESHWYKAYKYSGPQSGKIGISGGLDWYGGFTIGHSVGPYVPGFATFQIGGKYDKLMFVLGHENFNMGAGGSGVATDPCIFTVTADGKKILDRLIYPYGVPERITLDIRGVNELKFSLVQGGGYIAVAEATLWKQGEQPVETGNLIKKKPVTTQLVKDLRPYFSNYRLKCVSPEDDMESIRINGREYTNALFASMDRAIIGHNPGWAYFNLRKQYSRLNFILGPVDNTDGKAGTGWITVKADDKIIFEHNLKYDDIAQEVSLDVTGCEMLAFYSEQESGSVDGGIAEIMLYPEGTEPAGSDKQDATIDPRLKQLPDVCKLISNIPPYTALALTEKQIYDGSSDYITFSMGGTKFNEGIVLYNKTNVFSNETSAFAVFDLGNEFDYITFTAGYIGKSGAMNDDILRIYADDELVFETTLKATYPNQHYSVAINRCRKLRFENQGVGTMNVAAFGVADIVLYRGKPVENDLFTHPEPACPDKIDLIDLGAPYIHYVSPMKNSKDPIFLDGSTKRNFFDLNGERIYKGFLLQTSKHFSLDHGVLSGSDGAAAGTIGGAAVGSAFVAGGVAVGGAVVGSTLVGAAALLILAAGGEALENSCAAFNTYGEYNSVTFTVACLNPYIRPGDYKETLLIGADQKVVAELTVYETMKPQTVTVPIDGCEQLMFWLANTDNWSGQYLFYDIRLSKAHAELDIPEDARLSNAVISQPFWSQKKIQNEWERQSGTGDRDLDRFYMYLSIAYEQLVKNLKVAEPRYEIYTYYLETNSGETCKAIMLESTIGDNLVSIPHELGGSTRILGNIRELREKLADLNNQKASGRLRIPEKALNVLEECTAITEKLYQEKSAEVSFLKTVCDTAMDIDGKSSTDTTIICPLFEGENAPGKNLQFVRNFVIR